MKLKKYICIIIVAILLLCGNNVMAESNVNNDFKGTRNIAVSIDLSDLENYVNGGRTYLEAMIRTSSVDWLNYSTSVQDMNLVISISFDFDSYDDYYQKVTYMLTYEPTIIKDENMYVESFSTLEMINYFLENMQENDLYNSETDEMDLFKEVKSDISFNTETVYEAKNERINEREETDENIFKKLEIKTKFNEGYEREIYIELASSFNNKKEYEEKLQERCEDLGAEFKSDNLGSDKITINFNAENESELTNYTMKILNSASGITTSREYRKGGRINETFSEFIDIDTLLTEDGTYKYSYEGKDYYSGISALEDEKEGYSTKDNTIIYSGRNNTVEFHYLIPFEFDEIRIITDLSSNYGKITRTVRMVSKTTIAENMHDKIKESLSKSLKDGMALNIYDNGAYRYYDIVYSGFSESKINSLTSELINGTSDLKINNKILPFLNSYISDNIEVSNICDLIQNYNNVKLEYVFKSGTEVEDGDETTYVVNSSKAEINYKCFDVVKFVLILIIVIIIIVVIVIIVNKIKKVLKNKKNAKTKEDTKEVEQGDKK